ncbi:hypothetical protein CLA01_37430 [Chryseobacterium lathyri]|jgi:hypothetical protein|uniref:Uncharacterized protein n=1 Tax=Chryseobacterium lathyri TaxID=395933 RepID=A0A511YEQ6_9FLAO|nr:hypothetical protein CLA01_37430 [Chryseobacterium lathyri]
MISIKYRTIAKILIGLGFLFSYFILLKFQLANNTFSFKIVRSEDLSWIEIVSDYPIKDIFYSSIIGYIFYLMNIIGCFVYSNNITRPTKIYNIILFIIILFLFIQDIYCINSLKNDIYNGSHIRIPILILILNIFFYKINYKNIS